MKINSLGETIKKEGIQYGRPIVKLDINEELGIETGVDKLISLLNKNDYLSDYLLISGSPMRYKKELIELTHKLLYYIEIETDGDISPKGISDLTNVTFCVILNKDTRHVPEFSLREYQVLSEYKRAYFLFNIKYRHELDIIQRKQERLNINPIYISIDNNIKDRNAIIRIANRRGWFITPKLETKE